ncbi:MAG: hypothetical protein H2045_04325 [Rhizobiales bacterium]|nr:hypothetical protein [Hyphomicrobiales bacterium]
MNSRNKFPNWKRNAFIQWISTGKDFGFGASAYTLADGQKVISFHGADTSLVDYTPLGMRWPAGDLGQVQPMN